jgi:protein gp37
MGYPTPIEWTDATWNPIGGCSIKSPGRPPWYAQKLAGTRLKNHPLYAGTTNTVTGKPVFNGHLTVSPDDHPT